MNQKESFENEPLKGVKTKVTLLKGQRKNHLFIRESFDFGKEATTILLGNKAALDIATWILDNVSVEETSDDTN